MLGDSLLESKATNDYERQVYSLYGRYIYIKVYILSCIWSCIYDRRSRCFVSFVGSAIFGSAAAATLWQIPQVSFHRTVESRFVWLLFVVIVVVVVFFLLLLYGWCSCWMPNYVHASSWTEAVAEAETEADAVAKAVAEAVAEGRGRGCRLLGTWLW